jgi:putative lipase involved disintegration of autophagic bodies
LRRQYAWILKSDVKLFIQQTVCGFDLLRANGKSYVCDVNGFSFVKTSKKYYDDCAQILKSVEKQSCHPSLVLTSYSSEMLLANIAPHLFTQTSPLLRLPPEDKAVVPLPSPVAQE